MRAYSIEDQERAWQAARQVLCSLGVRAFLFRAYRPYVLKLYAAARRWRGEELVVACERVLAEYVKKGLRPEVLIAIRDNVFGIGGPDFGGAGPEP